MYYRFSQVPQVVLDYSSYDIYVYICQSCNHVPLQYATAAAVQENTPPPNAFVAYLLSLSAESFSEATTQSSRL